jgi:hypothetical protein
MIADFPYDDIEKAIGNQKLPELDEIIDSMKKSSWTTCIQYYSLVENSNEQVRFVLTEKLLEKFETKEMITRNPDTVQLIKYHLALGLPKVERTLYLLKTRLSKKEFQKHAEIAVHLNDANRVAKKINTRYSRLLKDVYGEGGLEPVDINVKVEDILQILRKPALAKESKRKEEIPVKKVSVGEELKEDNEVFEEPDDDEVEDERDEVEDERDEVEDERDEVDNITEEEKLISKSDPVKKFENILKMTMESIIGEEVVDDAINKAMTQHKSLNLHLHPDVKDSYILFMSEVLYRSETRIKILRKLLKKENVWQRKIKEKKTKAENGEENTDFDFITMMKDSFDVV